MSGFASVTVVTISGAFIVGMVLVMLGSLRPVLAKQFQVSEGRMEWLLSSLNLTLIAMMLASGILIDRFGVESVLIAGSFLTGAALFGLALSTNPTRAMLAILLAGAGGACLSTGSVVLMPHAFYSAHVAASLNLGNVFFGLGALVTPAVIDRFLPRLGYRRALCSIAVICLLPALAAALTSRDVYPPRAALAPGDLGRVLSHPILWLGALVFFLYNPIEEWVSSWAKHYATDAGFAERRAEWLIVGFWLAFLGSRLLASFLERSIFARPGGQQGFMIALGLAAAITLGGLASSPRRFSAGLNLLLLGACLGPIFPTLVGVLFEQVPKHHVPEAYGTVYGAMFAIGALSNLFVPPLISAYGRRVNVQRAMRIPMILAVLMALAALVLALFPEL
jgi:fucose permease